MINRPLQAWLKPLIYLLFTAFACFASDEGVTEFEGVKLRVYSMAPERVELHWLDPQTRKPDQRFYKLREKLAEDGHQADFLSNAGIYEPGCVPSGLHVQAGRELRPLNLEDGEDNFYLKPNRVLLIDTQRRAHIVESQRYASTNLQPRLALQSEPMLLIDGKIHPGFSPTSKHRRHRNGVGIRADGQLVFACTLTEQQTFITLHEFASFFKAQGCRNALFLDGDLSRMLIAPAQELRVSNVYAAFLAVTSPEAKPE